MGNHFRLTPNGNKLHAAAEAAKVAAAERRQKELAEQQATLAQAATDRAYAQEERAREAEEARTAAAFQRQQEEVEEVRKLIANGHRLAKSHELSELADAYKQSPAAAQELLAELRGKNVLLVPHQRNHKGHELPRDIFFAKEPGIKLIPSTIFWALLSEAYEAEKAARVEHKRAGSVKLARSVNAMYGRDDKLTRHTGKAVRARESGALDRVGKNRAQRLANQPAKGGSGSKPGFPKKNEGEKKGGKNK